ncbi:restriction endonuclease subunit S [Maritimibacter alexandrii]|uniref:restriction endonuclease subunit S n=1 Tax=Maritimibacter alexandrii TaxID=2570355 RepID=UPI0011088A6A|nr:restriction endonuclease subunit S [Maritimibacter alexandrii]
MGQTAIRANLIRRSCIGTIPDDWKVVSVSDIVDRKPNAIVGGPFGSDLVSTDYVPAGIPVVRGANMSASTVSGDFVFVSEAKGKILAANMACPGDVVFTQRGTLGQVAIVPEAPFEKYLISQSQMKLSANSEVIHKPYLLHYFASFAGQKQILDSAIQTGVPHTNLSILRNYAVPLPSLKEQEAIAEALSDADALIEGLERLIAKKRLIKQGAMQDLLTAKRRLPGFSGVWMETTIQDIASVDPEALGAGTPKDRIIKYISLEDVNRGALNGWSETKFADAPSRARRILRENNVLLGTVRPNLQSHHLFVQQGEDWIGSTGFAVLRVRPELCSARYLFELIMSSIIGRQIDELIAGSNYPAISNRDVRKLAVSLPSLAEQEAISQILGDMDAEIAALQNRLEKARQMKEGMMQNLLTGRIRLV